MNYFGMINTTKACIPLLKESKGPLMTVTGLDLGGTADPQQYQAGNDADKRDACHEQVPEVADKVTHFDSFN